jgi:excisionase family DNA binding protein
MAVADERQTFTVPEASELLGISKSLGYELAQAGLFPCRVIHAGRRVLVPRAELERLLGPLPGAVAVDLTETRQEA